MNNPFETKRTNPFIPILVGIVFGSIIALLLAPESGEDLRDDLVSGAKKGWGQLSDKAEDEADNVKKYAKKTRRYFKSKF